jgi:hypothetical protein
MDDDLAMLLWIWQSCNKGKRQNRGDNALLNHRCCCHQHRISHYEPDAARSGFMRQAFFSFVNVVLSSKCYFTELFYSFNYCFDNAEYTPAKLIMNTSITPIVIDTFQIRDGFLYQ